MTHQFRHDVLSHIGLLQLIDKRVSHPVNGGTALTYDASIIEVALEATGDVMCPVVVFARWFVVEQKYLPLTTTILHIVQELMSVQRTVQWHGTVSIDGFELLIRFSRIDHQTPNPLDLFDVVSFELTGLRGTQPCVQHPPVLNFQVFTFLGLFAAQAGKQLGQLRAIPAHSLFIRPFVRFFTCRQPVERVTTAIVQYHAPTEELFQGGQIIGLGFETDVALAQQDVAILLYQRGRHLIDFNPFGLGDKGVEPKLELAHRLVLDPLTGFSLDESRQCMGERYPTAGAS